MIYRNLKIEKDQLEEVKDGIEEGKLWSSIYTLLKEPDYLCGIIRLVEKNKKKELDEEKLSHAIYHSQSMFIAKINVDDNNRTNEIVELVKTKICDKISEYNYFFLEFKHSKENILTEEEVKLITDPIFKATEEETSVNWNVHRDERLKATTDLYIVATFLSKKRDREEDMIDCLLDEINDIDLGEYKNILIKKAEQHAKQIIDDYEEHLDAVVFSMEDFLTGAAEAIKILKNEKK